MKQRFTLDGKSVLITGGTGSFGRAFVRCVLEKFRPARWSCSRATS